MCITTSTGFIESTARKIIDYASAAATAIARMDQIGVHKMLVMPPPFNPDNPNLYTYSVFSEVVRDNPERLAMVGGGGLLNPPIHEAIRSGRVTDEITREFQARAEEVVASGAAGFGELTALHLSFFSRHPFLAVPPDHPLFLLLAEIAAREGMPLDIHMEAVVEDMPLPSGFLSPPNPAMLEENIQAFERLLSHDRDAPIVWAHVGWDSTGHMSTDLLRRLLGSHPNLYMSIKVLEQSGRQFARNRPVEDGLLKPEWIELITDFPDRFVFGADQFYGITGFTPSRPQSSHATWSLVTQLPDDLALKVACENPRMIYRLQ